MSDFTESEIQEQQFDNIQWNQIQGALDIFDPVDIDLLQRCTVSPDGIAFKTSVAGQYSEASQDQKVTYAQILINLLKNVTNPEVQQFAFTRISQILGKSPSKSIKFFTSDNGFVACGPMLRILKHSVDAKIVLGTARAAALILSSCYNAEDMTQLIAWAIEELNKATGASTSSAIEVLAIALRSREARVTFAQQNGISLLVQAIDKNRGNAQLIYEACLCLWCLSFCEEALPAFLNIGAVRAIVEQVTAAPREKVVRIGIAALRNLIGKHDSIFNEEMIDSGVLKTLGTFKEKKWGDDDIMDDIICVRDSLLKNFRELSSLERYEKELKSKQLTKGHLHTEKFWREHVQEFEKENFLLIRQLVEMLGDADNVDSIAIACYDLGEFVRFYPTGKAVCKNLEVKEALMPLLENQNENVKKEALLAVSKMMVDNWEHVN